MLIYATQVIQLWNIQLQNCIQISLNNTQDMNQNRKEYVFVLVSNRCFWVWSTGCGDSTASGETTCWTPFECWAVIGWRSYPDTAPFLFHHRPSARPASPPLPGSRRVIVKKTLNQICTNFLMQMFPHLPLLCRCAAQQHVEQNMRQQVDCDLVIVFDDETTAGEDSAGQLVSHLKNKTTSKNLSL